jgi:tetratricopeptide (TPR) repeat protein
MVFQGICACGPVLASGLYFDAISLIYTEKPDLEAAERLLRQSVSLDPSAFFVSIELGDVWVKRGSREDALHAYADALQHAPDDLQLRRSIEEQIKSVSSVPLDQVRQLRDPFLE